MDVFIQGNSYISYCIQECNMTCTCEKCNQKRVIDCLFVKADVNLQFRQTQLFVKVNSLSFGTMAESCWESSSEEELFFLRSQHLLLSRRKRMVSTYFQSLQYHWFCAVVCNAIFLLLFRSGCVDE